jgi:hypothetical protein
VDRVELEGSFPVTLLTEDSEGVKERALELLEESLRNMQIADHTDVPSTTNKDNMAPDLKSAVTKLNKATSLLFRILSVLGDEWHPDAKLPELTMDDLDKTIVDADAAIQNLIDANDRAKDLADSRKGILHKLGKGAKSICVHLKPFLKTFLAVGVQGSAVNQLLSAPNSRLDTNSQSIWVIVQRPLSTYWRMFP